MARTKRRGKVARKSRVQTRRNNAMKPRVQTRRNNAVKKSVRRKRPRRSKRKQLGGMDHPSIPPQTAPLTPGDKFNFNLVVRKLSDEYKEIPVGGKDPNNLFNYYTHFKSLFGETDDSINFSTNPMQDLPGNAKDKGEGFSYSLYKLEFPEKNKTFIVLEHIGTPKMKTLYYDKEDIDCYKFGDLRTEFQNQLTEEKAPAVSGRPDESSALSRLTEFFRTSCKLSKSTSGSIAEHIKSISNSLLGGKTISEHILGTLQ